MSESGSKYFLSASQETSSRSRLFRPKELREFVFPGIGMIMHSLFWVKHAAHLHRQNIDPLGQDRLLVYVESEEGEVFYDESILWRDISLPDQSDRLADARDVFSELYAFAEKEPPEYVPLEKPAEQKHDPGRRKWISALSDGLCELDFKDDGRVIADFSANLNKQQCWEFQKATPAHIRASLYGPAVQFESANRFKNWIDEPSIVEDARRDTETAADNTGVLSRVTRLVRG